MSRDLSYAALEAVEGDVVYPFYGIELLFDNDQTIRLWTGVGTLNFQDTEWVGTGALLDIDTVEETSEISARGARVSLSGVPGEVISLALNEAYQGRACNIYIGFIVEDTFGITSQDGSFILQQDGGILSLDMVTMDSIFSGYMDQLNISEGASAATVELLVENKLVDLERPRVARYTSAYQKSIFSGDLGLDFVESLQDKEILWGRTA